MMGSAASVTVNGRRAARRGLTLATLCAAVLIAQVDTSVVNLAVRPIGEHFHAGVGTLQWVVDSYNLAYAVLLLTGGLLADLYGRRLVFMAGAATFSTASLLCALASSAGLLVAGRAVAGVGAALLLPSSLAVIRVAWQQAAGLTPVAAGVALVPMAVVYGVVSPFSGPLASRFGTRPMNAGGVAVIGCGLLAVAATADWNRLAAAEAGLVLTGLGMGLATGPLMATAVGAVAAARSGTAAALINVARMAGATLGVAVLGAVYAMAGGGPGGLRRALAIGGAAQLIAAAVAWRSTRRA